MSCGAGKLFPQPQPAFRAARPPFSAAHAHPEDVLGHWTICFSSPGPEHVHVRPLVAWRVTWGKHLYVQANRFRVVIHHLPDYMCSFLLFFHIHIIFVFICFFFCFCSLLFGPFSFSVSFLFSVSLFLSLLSVIFLVFPALSLSLSLAVSLLTITLTTTWKFTTWKFTQTYNFGNSRVSNSVCFFGQHL